MKVPNRLAFNVDRPPKLATSGALGATWADCKMARGMIRDQRVELTELLFGKSVMYIDSLLNGFRTPAVRLLFLSPPFSFTLSTSLSFPSLAFPIARAAIMSE